MKSQVIGKMQGGPKTARRWICKCAEAAHGIYQWLGCNRWQYEVDGYPGVELYRTNLNQFTYSSIIHSNKMYVI